MKNEKTAKRLQIALQNAGISQRELSERANVKESSISQYVKGKYIPSNINAGRIGKVLNVSPVWLMGFDVPMNGVVASPVDELSDIYSSINNDGRKHLIEYARMLQKSGMYKKENNDETAK